MANPITLPLDQLHENQDNPRDVYDEAAQHELVDSIKANGVITPLVVWPSANGKGESNGYVILAGHRRFRAAKEAGLEEVPVHVATAGSWNETAYMVADNVIRSDLSPLEEARAYETLVKAGEPPAKVAKMVGRSKAIVESRLNLLVLPDVAQELIGNGSVPLGCAETLVAIASKEPKLAELVAAQLAAVPSSQAFFRSAPADVVNEVLSIATPVAYSVGGWNDPVIPSKTWNEPWLPHIESKLGSHAKPVTEAWDALPELPGGQQYMVDQLFQARQRACFSLDEDDVDSARAYGCLLALKDEDEDDRFYLCDPEFVSVCLVKRIEAWVAAEPAKIANLTGKPAAKPDVKPSDAKAAEQQERKEDNERRYEARVAARSRNLDLGVKAWQTDFPLDKEAAVFLAEHVLILFGKPLAQAARLVAEQPTKTLGNGKQVVTYPRGDLDDAVKKLREKLTRCTTPDEVWAELARHLAVLHLVDTAGLPGADANPVYEPFDLQHSKLVNKLATKAMPPSVKKARAAAAKAKREQKG